MWRYLNNSRVISLLCILQCFLTFNIQGSQIYVRGEWKNGPKSVVLSYYEDAATAKVRDLKSIIDPATGSFEFHIEAKYAMILRFYMPGDPGFIAMPGDSVNVSIVEVQGKLNVEFKGAKQSGHSFLSSLTTKFGGYTKFKKSLIDQETLTEYKEVITNRFDSCVAFLQTDFSSESEQFKAIAKDFLRIRYYNELITPINSGEFSRLELPPGYFDQVDASFFKKDDLLGFREFILIVSWYNSYYYSSTQSDSYFYDSVNITNRIQSAFLNFEGRVKNHLLLSIFQMVTEYGTAQSKIQIDSLYQYLSAAFVNDPEQFVQIEEFKRGFEKVDKPLPIELLAQQLKTLDGSEVSLNEAISTNEVIYIDFWASWCAPCIAEMPREKELISELRDRNVKFILISIDEDENKWRNAVTKIDMDTEHYLMGDGFESGLFKYLSFRGIPEYMILDRKGRLTSKHAPRPGVILKHQELLLSLVD